MILWLLFIVIAFGLVFPTFAQKFDGLAQTPPMGWNSQNTFASHINERLVREIADTMVENGMQAVGYRYIVLDDCWSAMQRDANGSLVAHPDKSASGMQALGEYLHGGPTIPLPTRTARRRVTAADTNERARVTLNATSPAASRRCRRAPCPA